VLIFLPAAPVKSIAPMLLNMSPNSFCIFTPPDCAVAPPPKIFEKSSRRFPVAFLLLFTELSVFVGISRILWLLLRIDLSNLIIKDLFVSSVSLSYSSKVISLKFNQIVNNITFLIHFLSAP
jgi:hypothetical protein